MYNKVRIIREKGNALTQKDTKGEDYTRRLELLSGAKWKKILDVQRPYRWNMKRLDLGKTLDVGCGIGRHLNHLPMGSLGVDHNEKSIEIAKSSGCQAMTVSEFKKSKKCIEKFDSMLLAHVLEHMPTQDGAAVIREYLPFVKKKVVVICPQEKGFPTDETHVNFLTPKDIEKVLTDLGLTIQKSFSFPFHRSAGRFFTYNETVVVAHK